MTNRFLTLAIAGLLSVLAQAAPSTPAVKTALPENLPAAVQRQIDSREAIEKKVEEGRTALRTWYQNALDAVKKDALAKGDLDGVVATDAERDRMDRDLTDAEKQALPKVSRGVRGQYDDGASAAGQAGEGGGDGVVAGVSATLGSWRNG